VEYPLVVVLVEKQSLPLKSSLGYLDWLLRGELTRLITSKRFKGARKESVVLVNNAIRKNKKFLLYGMGDVGSLNNENAASLFKDLACCLNGMKINNFIFMPSQNVINHLELVRASFKEFIYEVCTQ
jgi:hypothetical protein